MHNRKGDNMEKTRKNQNPEILASLKRVAAALDGIGPEKRKEILDSIAGLLDSIHNAE